jgi:hypothetical protein
MIIELVDYKITSYSSAGNPDIVIKAVAMIEDAVVTRKATFYEPEEYGPALCETTINLYEYEEELTREIVIELLEEYGEWTPCDTGDS